MSIENQPGKKSLVPAPSPTWGEVAGEDEDAKVVRFFTGEGVVTFPRSELRRWDHVAGEPEVLTIRAGTDHVVIEGAGLSEIRAALDAGRLCEVRVNHERSKARPGPRVRRITIETA